MPLDVHVLCETLSVAIGLASIIIGWSAFRYGERAQPAFTGSGVPELTWGHRLEISAAAQRARAASTARALYANGGLASAAAIVLGLTAAHSASGFALTIGNSIAAALLTGALVLQIRHFRAMRLSRAREAFDRFYVGTGLCKYETFEPALARFAVEHQTAHRIVYRSLTADRKAATAEHEREMEAYVAGLARVLT